MGDKVTLKDVVHVAVVAVGTLLGSAAADPEIVVAGGNPSALSWNATDAAHKYTPSTNSYTSLASLPQASTYLGSFKENSSKVHFCQGYNASGESQNNHYKYDSASNTWTSLSGAGAYHAVGSASLSDVPRGLIFNGYDKANKSNVSYCKAWNFDSETWETRANVPVASRNVGGGYQTNAAAHKSAGYTSSSESSHYKYVWSSNSWTSKADDPVGGEYRIGGSTTGDHFFNFGKWQAGTQNNRWSEDSWTSRASMPTARAATASGTESGLIYVFGGHSLTDSTRIVIAESEKFDDSTDTWTSITNLPSALREVGVTEFGEVEPVEITINVDDTLESSDVVATSPYSVLDQVTLQDGLNWQSSLSVYETLELVEQVSRIPVPLRLDDCVLLEETVGCFRLRETTDVITFSEDVELKSSTTPTLHTVTLSSGLGIDLSETLQTQEQIRVFRVRDCSDTATLTQAIELKSEFHTTYILEIGESVFVSETTETELRYGRQVDSYVTLQHGLALLFRWQTSTADSAALNDSLDLNVKLNEDGVTLYDAVRNWANPLVQESLTVTDSVTCRRVQEYVEEILQVTDLVQFERPIYDIISVDEVVASLRSLSADEVTLSDQLQTNVLYPEDVTEFEEELTTSNVPATDQCQLQEQIEIYISQIYPVGDNVYASDTVSRTLPTVDLDDVLNVTDQVSKGPLLEVSDELTSSDAVHVASYIVKISDSVTVYDKVKQYFKWLKQLAEYVNLYDRASSLTQDLYEDLEPAETLQTEQRPAKHADVYESLYVNDSWEGTPECSPAEQVLLQDLLSKTLTFTLADDEVPTDSLLFRIQKPDYDTVLIGDSLELQIRRAPIGRKRTWWRVYGIWR